MNLEQAYHTHQEDILRVAQRLYRRYRGDGADILSNVTVAFLEAVEEEDPLILARRVTERALKHARRHAEVPLKGDIPARRESLLSDLGEDAKIVVSTLTKAPEEVLEGLWRSLDDRPCSTGLRRQSCYRQQVLDYLHAKLIESGWTVRRMAKAFSEIREVIL